MTAIEFENISKQYRLGLVSTQTLSHDLRRFWITNVLGKENPYLKIGETNDRATKGTSDYVWALRDINFKVEQGDVVGIIGKNGAGKSTLLKLLSRVTGPTTGTIRAHGRIGSLLEVGTGFHGEMTGRENIFMNGAILGMTRQEIQSKLDAIIDFSGCERYIDTPVKRYSSGMVVRLGFAVAAFLEPEILVVYEVLAVGDAEFQKKAIGKMKDVSHNDGRTVLFVSHNMNSVKALCQKGIVLDKGQIVCDDVVDKAIEFYLSSTPFIITDTYAEIDDSQRQMHRSLAVKFLSVEIMKKEALFAVDEDITLRFRLLSSIDKDKCRMDVGIDDYMDAPLASYNSEYFFSIRKGEIKELECTLKNPGLYFGRYSIAMSVGEGSALTGGMRNYDVVHRAISFEIDRLKKSENVKFVNWEAGFGTIRLQASIKEL